MNTTPETIADSARGREISLSDYEIIFFSTTVWGSAFKRPQKLSLRLAESYKALYIEHPSYTAETLTLTLRHASPRLDVLSVSASCSEEFECLIGRMAGDGNVDSIAYFYSFAFHSVPFIVDFKKVIYDCAFDPCPLQLDGFDHIKMERRLLNKASAVITSSRTLFESKLHQHPNVHYVPASTYSDEVFDKNELLPLTTEQFKDGKTIGYVGLVDKRIDLRLIHETAKLLPGCSFVLIGPVNIEIHPAMIPDNVFFLGEKPKETLHSYMKAFDIAMVPFVVNNHTKHLCPSKVLEYMAAKKNIICTALPGILREFPFCVEYTDGEYDFAKRIERIIEERPTPNLGKYSEYLKTRCWSQTKLKIKRILEE